MLVPNLNIQWGDVSVSKIWNHWGQRSQGIGNLLWNLRMYLNSMDLNLLLRSSTHCMHGRSLRSWVFHSPWAGRYANQNLPTQSIIAHPDLLPYLDSWGKVHTQSYYLYKINEVELLQGNGALWAIFKIPQSLCLLRWLLHQSTIVRPDFHMNLLLQLS